jgi:DNA-binding transcriptional LysR family regulator
MKNATLRQLKVFEAVARNLSFSRAADELHLSQPAVSTLVKQLGAHAGLPLFERIGKKTYLTPAGNELLPRVRAISQQIREAEEALAQLKGVSGGTLNVSVISAAEYFFPRLLAEFTRRHPGVLLNLAVHNREELLRQMADNLTDLAVMVSPPRGMDTIAEPFAPHPYVVVAAPDHPLAGRRRIPVAALMRERFVIRERGSETWNAMQQAFGRRQAKLQVALEITSTETIKQAVIAGMGVSFLSAHTIGMELRTRSLAVLDVQGFPLRLRWFVVHRENKRLPPVAVAFKHFLRDEGAALIERITRATPPRRSSRSRASGSGSGRGPHQ